MAEPGSPRLFLVDGYALIYRAFYALISRPLRTSRGENTSAVWGIANFLQRLMTRHHPEYVGWVHDSGLSFRHETYPDYKATREKLTEELQADFDTGLERIEQLLEAYRIPIIALDGYEADDVIGTLARKASEIGLNTVVISGDKDFHQLVREGVWLLNPGRGGPAAVEEHWVSMENADERLGVPPGNVTDYLALTGDTSDNVPGVPGIGEKTARDLIAEYGDLEQIIAHAEGIVKKRPREALLANIDKARLSRMLVTIRDDLEVVLDLEKFRVREPDTRKLRDLFVELEFHSLVRETGEEPGEAPARAEKVDYTTIDAPDKLNALVMRARQMGVISLRCETTQGGGVAATTNPLRSRLVGIAIAVGDGEASYIPIAHRERGESQVELGDLGGGETAGSVSSATLRRNAGSTQGGIASRLLDGGSSSVVNLAPFLSPELAPLRDLLEDESIAKVAENAKHELLVLRRAGVTLRGINFDAMIASYLLEPGRRSHTLDVLTLELYGRRMTTFEELAGKGRQAVSFDQVPVAAAREYSAGIADMTLRVSGALEPQLREHGLAPLFREIEIPLVSVLAEMEWTGISIDLNWFRSLKERFQRERDRVSREIYATAGEEFNINSNQQLREILFEKLGLPVIKRTATGASTDASVLQQFADQGEKLPALILEYREFAKLESTYLDALPALVHPETGRLHTSFSQTVASTGRLASSDPNLQNIPVRRELGRDIRRGFIPRRGWQLLAADYSQIELRLLAHLSSDPAFVNAFRQGGDIHRQTASVIFGVDPVDVTGEMRARAKTINFATIYGQGPRALSMQLGIDFAEARLFIQTYFERFSGIRVYLDSCVEFAREHGYVETIFGRRRYIPELRDRNFNIRAFGERTAANSPLQGSAADLIKVAMIRIDRVIRERRLEARMLLQVHDELVFEVPPGELSAVSAMVKEEMEGAAKLSVPLLVDVGVGDNWVSAKGGG
jgi:DNA polymerase-1